tara:strand:+ start:18 stop:767 length:750 start_codon:yes stop_codon:yes gene_type:complete
MGLMSKLDAVNEMLFNSGEQLVTSLTDDLNTDVNLAVFILDQATLEAQLRGMAVNRRPIKVFPSRTGPTGHAARPISDATKGRVQLSPFTDNMITGSLISAQLITESISDDLDIRITTAPRRFGIESNGTDYNVLFNVTDNTDEFATSEELTISIVEYIEFKDLETSVQKGIAASASRQYQMFVQGDRDVDRLLAERAAMLTAKGRSADANDKARNIFASGDSSLRRIVSQRGNAHNDPSRFRFWRYTT